MIKTIPLERILFIDIETVPGFGCMGRLPENEQCFGIKNKISEKR
jgi:hypothetical protein